MISIKKTHTNFLNDIYVGVLAYIIELSEFGYKEKEEIVAKDASCFSYILITGEEPLKQMSAVATLCKEIQLLNPYTKILIYTDGMIRPVNMTNLKSIEFIVFPKLKETGLSYSKRINENALKWLGKSGAKIVFKVTGEEDYDEINMILAALLIKRNQVYIDINNNKFVELAFSACNHGFNLFIKYDGVWFDEN